MKTTTAVLSVLLCVSTGAVPVRAASQVSASPVAVEWKPSETLPTKVARPFYGYLPSGEFVVAGGSDFVDGKKVYRAGIDVRAQDGTWTRVGALPNVVAEGVSCETPKGLFIAGGTDGEKVFSTAALMTEDVLLAGREGAPRTDCSLRQEFVRGAPSRPASSRNVDTSSA